MKFAVYSSAFLCLSLLLPIGCSVKSDTHEISKPRVIVTCDPELDDNNSLIRYLLFSTDFETLGLVYASSQFHWKGDGKGGTQYIQGREYSRPGRNLGPQKSWRWAVGERFIDENVEAYAKVYPNLKVHNSNYPAPEYLKSIIREGNTAFEGDMSADSPGSDLIKAVLLDDDPRPVFIQVWGGPSTASRALKSIEEEFFGKPEWDAIKSKVSSKAKLCLSGQQDSTFSAYIKPNWPEVESIILNAGVIVLGYGANRSVSEPADTLYYSASWTNEHISNKGELGNRYRVWGDGKQMFKGDFTDYFGMNGYTADALRKMGYWVWFPPQRAGSFISEGDTPMFLNLIGNGLRAFEGQEYGGWAGRRKEMTPEERKSGFTVPYAMRAAKDDVLPDFVPAVQNNFAGRMAWSVTPSYTAANHEPVLQGHVAMMAKAGERVSIKTKVSDPDGDNLSLSWSQYKVGSFKGDVSFSSTDSSSTIVTIPYEAKSGETIHLILTAIDDGLIPMTSYMRIILTIK